MPTVKLVIPWEKQRDAKRAALAAWDQSEYVRLSRRPTSLIECFESLGLCLEIDDDDNIVGMSWDTNDTDLLRIRWLFEAVAPFVVPISFQFPCSLNNEWRHWTLGQSGVQEVRLRATMIFEPIE